MVYNKMEPTCEFQLSSPNGVYYSGQTVSGVITLITPRIYFEVGIRIVGESKVSWTEAESNRKANGKYETRTFHFRSKKVYIDNSTDLHERSALEPGTYTYNFNFPLPRSCPTSCEGKYGHTRYVLWLRLATCFVKNAYVFNKPLTVLRTVDLNLNPSFRVPLQAEEMSTLDCWRCNSGKISYSLRVPFGAYASGQTLRYSLLIQNQSMTDIRGYTVKFNEYITFTAHYPHQKTRETNTTLVVQNHTDDTCLRLSNRQFNGELVLPALPPDTEGNRLIRVRHTLDIELALGRCHTNKCISVPIFIGTVPIRETEEDINGFTPIMASAPDMPSASTMPSAPIMPSAPLLEINDDGDLPPSYGDFKPPTFEEAIRSYSPFKDPDANEHTNVIGFRPLYPVYANPNRK